MTRRLMVFLILLAVAALPALAQQKAASKEASPEADDSHCIGSDPDAPAVLEVFSDHQCPACRRFYLEVTRPLMADYAMKGKVCVVYYEFPLNIHQHAHQAARFTQAARRLGQQDWIRVTDALYLKQPEWSQSGDVEAVVASALGPEKMSKLKSHLDLAKIDAEIERDKTLGRQRNVRSTPTVFLTVNGTTERIPPGVQYQILRRYLDTVLAQAR